MCGICGKISWQRQPSESLLAAMNERLLHRGPDTGAVWCSGPAGLAHRRLAIIDLSEQGRQPMSDGEGRVWITFNGEIYNYLELRAELEKLGARFRTQTDTEVIIEAYKQWGRAAVAKLNGMFAFAIWDADSQTLLIARDRLGKKPLFYYEAADSGITFASELKSLIVDPEVPREIDRGAVAQYLRLGYLLTSRTIYKGVKKLPPAHLLVLERGGQPRLERYWDLAQSFRSKARYRSEEEAAERLTELLDDAVKIRLMSDVPLGAFLSGGIDSSAIAASMCRARDAAGNLTFTAAFNEESFNEFKEARRVAEHLGVWHRERLIDARLAGELSKIVYFADEPFADTSMVPMYFLSQFTRQHVTVALSGDGADEIFAGYETYAADKMQRLLRFLPSGWSRLASAVYRNCVPRDYGKVSLDYKILHFLQGVERPFMQAHYSWRELFDDREFAALIRPELAEAAVESHPCADFIAFDREVAECDPLDRAMYVDIKTWLADDILVKADRMTMAHALEGRAPFLDYRIVEFAAALPIELKMKGFKKKYLLKQSQIKRLPAATLNRKKSGFNAPIAGWLGGALGEAVREAAGGAVLSEYLQPGVAATLLKDHLEKRSDNSFKLFTLLNLHLWQKAFTEAGNTAKSRAVGSS